MKSPPTPLLFYSILVSVIITVALSSPQGAATEASKKVAMGEPLTKAPKPGKKDEERKAKPASISGNYSLTTSVDREDYRAYLKAMEYSEESQETQRKIKQHYMSWGKLNQTHWQVKRVTINPNMTTSFIFQSGEEFDAELPDGRMKAHSFTVDEKERIAVKTVKMDGFNAVQEMRFTKNGFNFTVTAKTATAKFEFVRVPWSGQYGGVFEHNWGGTFKKAFQSKGKGKGKPGSG